MKLHEDGFFADFARKGVTAGLETMRCIRMSGFNNLADKFNGLHPCLLDDIRLGILIPAALPDLFVIQIPLDQLPNFIFLPGRYAFLHGMLLFGILAFQHDKACIFEDNFSIHKKRNMELMEFAEQEVDKPFFFFSFNELASTSTYDL